MDDINSHVSLKIRSAIKAKLVELGTYVDDELPDYIMVLVVNKKSKEQMDNDLSLFLGHNTEHFTSWLASVLERLESAGAITSSAAATSAVGEKVSAKPKEDQSVSSATQDSKKIGVKLKSSDNLNTITTKEREDRKKTEERKLEKKERKKKKKEKKDLEKKLKRAAKEAKRKNLEAQELAIKENKTSVPISEPEKVTSIIETRKCIEVKPSHEPAVKRKRSSSQGSEAESGSPGPKRSVVEAVGKNKTLTITKTIRNEHHKPSKDLELGAETDTRPPAAKTHVKEKVESGSEKKAAKHSHKAAKIVISSDDEDKSATVAEAAGNRGSSEEEVGDDTQEAEVDQSPESVAHDNEELTDDIVDLKTQETELEQELQDDEEHQQDQEAEHARSREAKKAHKSSRHPSSQHKQKPVSVLDRLGPPRSAQNSCSSPEPDQVSASDDHEGRHSADELSSKSSKRRVVNLLEESSFPPRHSSSDKRNSSSKAVAAPTPGKKLEARNFVEKSSRSTDLPSKPAVSSAVRRQRKEKSTNETDSETEDSSVSSSALQSKVEVTGRDRRAGSSRGSSTRAPNTSLILRAVADAHRSVTSAKRTSSQLDEPPQHKSSSRPAKKPMLEVFSRSYREREEGRLTSTTGSAPLKEAKIQKLSITVANPPRSALADGVADSTSDDDVRKPSALARLSRGTHPSSSIKRRLDSPGRVSSSRGGRYLVADVIDDEDDVRTRILPRPSLLVTNQIADTNMEEVEEYIEEVEEWEEEVESIGRAPSVDLTAAATHVVDPRMLPLDEIIIVLTRGKRCYWRCEAKYSTRCMYWPACRLGDKCQYQHPTVPCK
ncbi:hypothetical protein HAZT_HAZT006961 [Hyalella azteca]|uniref:Zinc finger CCCH domain-containing protein 14 n=1 Tax=Hyalella azteca TaxID=294128 RepID=A0A6A0GYU1_HYAAZ|nr:hypothetical protein HAZT_HAZT006961 [Hyalella azteca]